MRLSNFKTKYRNSKCSNRNRKCKTKKNIKKVFPDAVQFYSTYQKQSFSLPDSIMHYISKNPETPEVYEKLVQTCKYFFHKNPILIVPRLYHTDDGWTTDEWHASARFKVNKKIINLNNISSKLWITEAVIIDPKTADEKSIVSLITPKIYDCQVEYLTLKNQIILFEELKIFASFAQEIDLEGSVVKYKDGTFVEAEKIFELFPAVVEIYFPSTPKITFKTVTELLKNPQFLKLDVFDLNDIPEDFDIERFFIYIKKNQLTEIDLYFSDAISDAYINGLTDIVNEMFEMENHDYKLPYIHFPATGFENVLKLLTLHNLASRERFNDNIDIIF